MALVPTGRSRREENREGLWATYFSVFKYTYIPEMDGELLPKGDQKMAASRPGHWVALHKTSVRSSLK